MIKQTQNAIVVTVLHDVVSDEYFVALVLLGLREARSDMLLLNFVFCAAHLTGPREYNDEQPEQEDGEVRIRHKQPALHITIADHIEGAQGEDYLDQDSQL